MHRVRAGVFSLTAVGGEDDAVEKEYLRWHLLDHMPEQYQLPGIILGSRWIADGPYLSARLAAEGPTGEVGNAVNYLVGDPVQKTLEDFVQLGSRLREMGRFPHARKPLQLAAPALLRQYAAPGALVSADVIPFRPHRGVLLIVEEPTGRADLNQWLQWLHTEHYPTALAVPGTAGAWIFGTTRSWELSSPGWNTARQYISVIYLDGDPLATTAALAPLIEQRWSSGAMRPVFAGPLRTMVAWEAWTPEAYLQEGRVP